ncbi:MAG TPA: hypothetical protein PKD85_06785, partial [Saprospiraceae bacterium]|nr:hypothetical protein [Saprospiraceae bacterium]
SHHEFVRRYELHLLPFKYVKIWHSGYMCHRGKNDRIVELYQQMNLPKPMYKVAMSRWLFILITTGVDITVCKKCEQRKK